MYVKLTNGQPSQFPYTVGQFRHDNPHTSFPKKIPDEMLRRHAVYPVEELAKPDFDPLVQHLVRDAMPHKEVIRIKNEQDATNPRTGEIDQNQVGQPVYGNKWFIGYTVENKPQAEAEASIRDTRNALLKETDWIVAKSYEAGEPVPVEWATYRQALRDISSQAGFPTDITWPTKPE